MSSRSESIGAIAKALAAAQAELGDAKYDRANPHFRNRYATLASIRAEVKSVLPKHGLAYVQCTEPHGSEGVCVVTTLMHESGEWIESKLFLPVQKRDAQGFGSALTYARRYSLAAIVGIASDEDDDGEGAVDRSSPKTQTASGPKATELEASLAKRLEAVSDFDALAAVGAEVHRAELPRAAKERLREAYKQAMGRLGSAKEAS